MPSLVGALVLALVATACSSSDDASGDDSVAAAASAKVEQGVRAFLLAFDQHDGDVFVGGMTENLCTNGFGEPCEALKSHASDLFAGQPSLDIRSLDAPVFDGDTAQVDLVSRVQTGLHHTHLDLVLTDGVWLVDNLELDAVTPVALPDGVPVVDVSLNEYQFGLDTTQLSSGYFALKVHNDGKLQHELVIKRVDANATLDGPAAENQYAIPVAGIQAIDPGATSNVVLAEQLPPGHYFIFCEVDDGQGGTHLDHGMSTEFTVTESL